MNLREYLFDYDFQILSTSSLNDLIALYWENFDVFIVLQIYDFIELVDAIERKIQLLQLYEIANAWML